MSASSTQHLPEPPEEVAVAIAIALTIALGADVDASNRETPWQRSTHVRPAWTSAHHDAWRAQTNAASSTYPE